MCVGGNYVSSRTDVEYFSRALTWFLKLHQFIPIYNITTRTSSESQLQSSSIHG